MIVAIITGFVVGGATNSPVLGVVAGAAWMILVTGMDRGRGRE
jgi:hypothetical protein